jgi:hypothetical protein
VLDIWLAARLMIFLEAIKAGKGFRTHAERGILSLNLQTGSNNCGKGLSTRAEHGSSQAVYELVMVVLREAEERHADYSPWVIGSLVLGMHEIFVSPDTCVFD